MVARRRLDFSGSSFVITRRISRFVYRLRVLLLRLLTPPRLRPLVWHLTRKETREECSRRSAESFSSIVRLYAHAVEKSIYAPAFDPHRGLERSRYLRALLADELAHSVDPETLSWARDMLELYESRRKYGLTPAEVGGALPRPLLDIATLEAFAASRRSVRNYNSTPVTDGDVLRLIDVMRWAPTSCHRQAVTVFVTLKPEQARAAHACCVGKSGFGEHIPAFAAFCADSNAYTFPEEFSLPYVDAAICFSFFLLAAHALGLGTVPMAWNQGRLDDEARLRKVLRIPDHFVIGVNCAFGVPLSRAATNPRKPPARWCQIIQ